MATKPGEPYLNGRDAPAQPGDEVVGGWLREQLEKMDARFRSRLERAIANGREHAPMLHLTDQQITLLRQALSSASLTSRTRIGRTIVSSRSSICGLTRRLCAQAGSFGAPPCDPMRI